MASFKRNQKSELQISELYISEHMFCSIMNSQLIASERHFQTMC